MHTFGSEKLRFVGTYLSVLYLLSYIRTTCLDVGIYVYILLFTRLRWFTILRRSTIGIYFPWFGEINCS